MNILDSIRPRVWRALQALRGVRFARTKLLWLTRWMLRPVYRLPCTVTMNDGARFRLAGDPLDDVILADTYGAFHDLYFPRGLDAIPSNEWILDLGAHHGVFSVAALTRYPDARLIAVEPDPSGIAALRVNLALNNLVDRAEWVEAAIAAREGIGLLTQSREGSWANELAPCDSHEPLRQVRTLTLDTILAGRRPYFVKCNAEGAEFEAIPQLFAAGCRPLCLALFIHPAAGDADALLRHVREAGYAIEPIMSTPDHPRYLCRLQKD